MKIYFYGQEHAGSFNHRDLQIIRSSAFQISLDQKLSHLPLTLHFINQKARLGTLVKLYQYLSRNYGLKQQMGLMTSMLVQDTYGLSIRTDTNTLNFVMVENESTTRHPITPWIVAHRLKHAYDFIHRRHIGEAIQMGRKLEHAFRDRPQLDTCAFRTDNLDADIEYFPEAFALWCFKGRIAKGFEAIEVCYADMIEWGIGKTIVL